MHHFMAVPACFISSPHAKREDDDFRIQDEDGMGKRYTWPFLLLHACHFLSNESVLGPSFSSMTSKVPIRKSSLYPRISHTPTFNTKSLHKSVFRKRTHTIMECKANQLAQLASWLQYASVQRHKSTLHPAAVGRKLPLSARKYQLALMGKIPHVGIIGAGVSGLRCADILAQNGAKVTILEARNRIGGRVRSWPSCSWEMKNLTGYHR